MRRVVVILLALARIARADEVDDLVARGEALAKQSEFSSAIEVFKSADAKRPRAKHACLIGLVYTRRELWPQAELFFALCRARATADDPLPKWIDEAQQQLTTKLTAAGAAPVTITVTPPDAHAHITVSSFAPDEIFEPRTIHLAPGRHVFDVAADGYVPASREVVISTSEPQTVVIELRSTADAAAEAARRAAPPPPTPTPTPSAPRSIVPTAVLLGGGALALAGGAVELFVYKPALDRLAASPDDKVYDARVASFRDRRDLTIGLYAGAVAAVAAGIVLRYTVFAPVAIGAAVDRGGGVVTLAWSR